MTLQQALHAYWDAANDYREAATRELTKVVKERYPTATKVRVTAILTESYSEHDITVLDGSGTVLNGDDDWPDLDDWLLEVTEGVCVSSDQETVDLS